MAGDRLAVERVQTGVRMEKRVVKVVRALADYLDMTMSDLLEGIVLHALENKPLPFGPDQMEVINSLKQVYGLDLTAADSHKLIEASTGDA